MSDDKGLPYHISIVQKAGAGDHVCLVAACREFAKRTGNTVYYDNLPDVIAAYHDPMVKYGRKGVSFISNPVPAHRQKDPGGYVNYYGTYLASLGLLEPGVEPELVLPVFGKMKSHVVIQPYSNFARNPPTEYVQELVDTFINLTGMDVYVIGKTTTPRTLVNVKYDLVCDGLTNIMEIIQNAAFVMCPRSLSAHLAAGYKKKAFVWVPDDGENWHLNYPGWPHVCQRWLTGIGSAKESLQNFLINNPLL